MPQTKLFEPTIPNSFVPDLDRYDKIILAFSGGKDSTACFLHLLDLGYKDRIELWHHQVDGRESESSFMDWPCTSSYCKAFADAFDVPIYFSWKEGGFEREMLREEDYTAPTLFEKPGGEIGRTKIVKNEKYKNTRRKFPQVSADLSVRWCSAYLKIDVCAAAIRNQNRFRNIKTLVVTGERGEESTARSKYDEFEPHKSDLRDGKWFKRHVDHWRPILNWYEADVWNIIEKHSVRVHPAYYLGWGRVSCCLCIFGSKDQWASAKTAVPKQFERVAQYEKEFDVTIQRNESIRELAAQGKAFDALEARQLEIATSLEYTENIIIEKIIDGIASANWELPEGAYGDTAGPE